MWHIGYDSRLGFIWFLEFYQVIFIYWGICVGLLLGVFCNDEKIKC